MNVTMDDSRLINVSQLRAFLKGTRKLAVASAAVSWPDKYRFIDAVVDRLDYSRLSRKDKRVVTAYLKKVTGYKRAQLFRLIDRAVSGELTRAVYRRVHPARIYTTGDIKLLETTDELHHRLSERATAEILRREFTVFGHGQYQTIAQVSHAHITNLRHSQIYKSVWVNSTRSMTSPIGTTMTPENFGRPGSIRVDTVHQRDVYHLNAVDEITQWEVVVCVPQITEEYMAWAIMEMLDQFPFVVFNFHSDRGSENINFQVSCLLQQLLIKQTKSRAGHTNDNALVETKNGSVIRKNMGWAHIRADYAALISQYYRDYLNHYLNYHRPCGYPTSITDPNGKIKKVYHVYQTPYEALKRLTGAKKFLKPENSFTKLDIMAYRHSDNEWAKIMRQAETKLWKLIKQADQKTGSHRRF